MAIEPPRPHYEAQNTLGQMYYHGEGMRANKKQARRPSCPWPTPWAYA